MAAVDKLLVIQAISRLLSQELKCLDDKSFPEEYYMLLQETYLHSLDLTREIEDLRAWIISKTPKESEVEEED